MHCCFQIGLTKIQHNMYFFDMMRRCHKCLNEISDNVYTGRQSQCPVCSADLHCCLNCSFYDAGAYNDCREPQAERVLDKARSNFCDFFRFRQTETLSDAPSQNTPGDKLEALFKKS
ncbi:MAG: hypothetical protein BWX55_00608 [Deltaproteobacteria bacterium ADurb.Bin022]|nr:MAG: hypothetical protein BWX55_00608 [Deltaproteobacteria bacterium ADurb.Bin022]